MSIIRINQLPEGSGNLSDDDVFLFMDDPSSGGITKKISLSQISTAVGGITSNTGLVPNSVSITNIVSISQANYDALVTKDSSTLYVIS